MNPDPMTGHSRIADFWSACRADLPYLPEAAPQAWAFGATREQADLLLDLVLRGVKTGTASSLADYEVDDEQLPREGELSVILDADLAPHALIETISVQIVPFDEVGAEHAFAEGEGDRSLEHWRIVHEQYWREPSQNPRGFEPQMPVVCERFRVLIAINSDRA